MNNTRIIGILAAGIMLGCDTPAVPVNEAESSTAGIHVVCLGDSLTAGKDLVDPETESYPALLETRLKKDGHQVHVTNAGQSGDTSFDALARLDFSLADRPDLVVVCLGSNDVFQGKRLEDLENNLKAIARRCLKARSRVVLCQMRIFANFGYGWAARYEKLFPRVAESTGVDLAPFPLKGVAGNPAFNLTDGIHPNPAGYAVFVDNVYDVVEKNIKALERERTKP